jgi:signal transduction histidine kinase
VVSLRCAGGHLAFDVVDDGNGFDPSIVRRGVGLRSLEERLEALGGVLEVRSASGSGTSVAGRVPLTTGEPS